ncbi:MAG: hypothetical protein C0501_28155 [Isosphaera sp.]|nr:hypothetical protein [Isosphaera sp.]
MLWVFLAVAAAGLFLLRYRRPRRRRWLLPRRPVAVPAASAVDRQHRHLQAGGRVGPAAVAAAAGQFDALLKAGRWDEVEQALAPGVGYAVQVRALAAVGSAEAGRVLERQLARRLSADPVEEAWYWADVAAGLRHLGVSAALPAVLRCADRAADLPAGPVLAAEALAFPSFPAVLASPADPHRRAALAALVAVARATRAGDIPPAVALRAGLGDLLAAAAEAEPAADPWLAAALLEAHRVGRRLEHWHRHLPADVRPLAEAQAARLRASAGARAAALRDLPGRLFARFAVAPSDEQRATLRFASEARLDVTGVLPHLPDPRAAWWSDAARCLAWCRAPAVGPLLAGRAARWLVSPRRRGRVLVLLPALRGHPGPDAERVLVRAAAFPDPCVRRAAVSALGWWPPFRPDEVLAVLRDLRAAADEVARPAAVAALARLGERAALAEVQRGLRADDREIRTATARRVAAEGLSWLWPELQELADGADADVGLTAAEAAEVLREHALGPTG